MDEHDERAARLLPCDYPGSMCGGQLESDKGYHWEYCRASSRDAVAAALREQAEERNADESAMAEAHKAEVERLRIAAQEMPVDEVESHFAQLEDERDDLRAKLAEAEAMNWTLWQALTPEKRHELNLEAPEFPIAKAEGKDG